MYLNVSRCQCLYRMEKIVLQWERIFGGLVSGREKSLVLCSLRGGIERWRRALREASLPGRASDAGNSFLGDLGDAQRSEKRNLYSEWVNCKLDFQNMTQKIESEAAAKLSHVKNNWALNFFGAKVCSWFGWRLEWKKKPGWNQNPAQTKLFGVQKIGGNLPTNQKSSNWPLVITAVIKTKSCSRTESLQLLLPACHMLFLSRHLLVLCTQKFYLARKRYIKKDTICEQLQTSCKAQFWHVDTRLHMWKSVKKKNKSDSRFGAKFERTKVWRKSVLSNWECFLRDLCDDFTWNSVTWFAYFRARFATWQSAFLHTQNLLLRLRDGYVHALFR